MLLLIKVLYILLIGLVTNALADQWIDPHNMNTNAKAKYVDSRLKKSSRASTTEGHSEECVDPQTDICYVHLRRVISVLMNSAHVDKSDPSKLHGHIRFSMDPDDFEFLDNFGKVDISLENLRKLNSIFSESFRRFSTFEYLDAVESFQQKLFSLIMNIRNLWLLGAVCLLYMMYQLVKHNFSLIYILKYLVILLFIIDFGFRYNQMHEDAENHNFGIVYSKECDTNKMSWSEWTKFLFRPRDCERKTVTPLDVFLYQLKVFITTLMGAFGTGMGGFGSNMFTTLPWGLNIIMWPVMLIFTFVIILFLMTVCTGHIIEFNILHMIKMKLGGGSHKDNMLTGATVEKLIDKVLHRPMVQNIHVNTDNQPSTDSTPLQVTDRKKPSSPDSPIKKPKKLGKKLQVSINSGTTANSDESKKKKSIGNNKKQLEKDGSHLEPQCKVPVANPESIELKPINDT